MTAKPIRLDTRLQHLGIAPFHPETGAAPVALPPMRTSTVRFRNLQALEDTQRNKADGKGRAVTYGRSGMETHEALEAIFCELEGADHALLAPSGLAAITLTLFSLLNTGDHMLVADCCYGPVRHFDKTVLSRMGIESTYVRARVPDLAAGLRPTTRVLYVESPGSLLFEMLDLPALAVFAREHNLILVTDNTWGSGYSYRPLALGAHVSVVAGTKYVGGHSDLLLGAVMVNDAALFTQLNDTHYAMGYAVSADDAWLAIRGARTLPIRMQHTAANALQVCQYLANHPLVSRVYHPAWPHDPGHALWQRDCLGSNGMLSVGLRLDHAAGRRVVDALTLFGIGFSWGGFESLVQWVDPNALRGHSYWTEDPQQSVLRFHIGLEATDDLIADLEQALAASGA